MRPLLALPLLLMTMLASCTTTPPAELNMTLRPDEAVRLTPSAAYPGISQTLDTRSSSEAEFVITTGDDEGRIGTRSVRPHREDACLVAWSVAGEPDPRHTNILQRDPSGALVVTRMPNRARDVLTRFEPPLVHFPAALVPGEPYEQSLRMLIADFDAPDKITREGVATHISSIRGTMPLRTDQGVRDAIVVRATLESVFGPARVRRITDRWFIEPIGLVGESWHEVVRVFGIVTEDRKQTIWRAGITPPPANAEGDES